MCMYMQCACICSMHVYVVCMYIEAPPEPSPRRVATYLLTYLLTSFLPYLLPSFLPYLLTYLLTALVQESRLQSFSGREWMGMAAASSIGYSHGAYAGYESPTDEP